ncbi:heptaprenyl diphosphate synthase component 1 [Bacillus sp. BRMEA1]|uniref:heptaprenyl diphosphate synthase component 1 n=1 Tax=Neobacillus endophyticus TaxID=2738405 RepID=UPI001565204D|nr:heptaprenyl diphosphate synthase component 1 [Neobacillus endophyticus]NRD80577.1 heptaprenyl diphosphate synthase component 1 [Neobacillus endophyticus]
MQNIPQKFTSVKEKLEKRVFDAYLLKYIETPIIDKDKLLILISMMDELELPFKTVEKYCLATMLIQIALDTHEHINKFSEDGKTRQLTVLAGDYYSGMYYKLLSETEDILMIKALSAGVKEINENKIMVYHQNSETIEKLMKSVKIIESSILIKLAGHLNLNRWSEILSNLFFFKRLLMERSRYIKGESSVLFDALKKVTFQKHEFTINDYSAEQQKLLLVCERYLEHSKQAIENEILNLSFINDLLSTRISALLDQYQPVVKTFVEEG